MSNHNTIRTHFRIPLSPLEPKREGSIFLISKLITGESENVCESCYVSTFRRPFHRLRIIVGPDNNIHMRNCEPNPQFLRPSMWISTCSQRWPHNCEITCSETNKCSKTQWGRTYALTMERLQMFENIFFALRESQAPPAFNHWC